MVDKGYNTQVAKGVFNILLFIIWPFLGFLYTLFRPITNLTYCIFICFFFLIGCSFDFHDITLDSHQYAVDFIKMSQLDIFTVFFYQLLVAERIDFYFTTIVLFLSRITDNPNFLFGTCSAITGGMVCKLFVLLKTEWQGSFNIYIWIISFLIFFASPYTGINAIRYYTALWLFLISAIMYFVYDRKKWLLGIICTPLFHNSFLVCIFLYFIGKFLKFDSKSLYYICLAVLIFSFTGWQSAILDFIPDNIGVFSRYESYIDASNINEFNQKMGGRHILNKLLPLYNNIIIILFVYFELIKNRNHQIICVSLLNFVLLLFSFNSLFSFIPSMARFQTLIDVLMYFYLFLFYKHNRNRVASLFILLFLPVLFLNIFKFVILHQAALDNVYLYQSCYDVIDFALNNVFV